MTNMKGAQCSVRKKYENRSRCQAFTFRPTVLKPEKCALALLHTPGAAAGPKTRTAMTRNCHARKQRKS